MRPEEFGEEKLIAAVPGSFGILETIASKLGCNRRTIQRALKKYPKFKQLVLLRV